MNGVSVSQKLRPNVAQSITRRTSLGDLPELLTVEEFAAWGGIGRNTAYEAVRRGEIKSVRIGRLVRIPKSALMELTR